jgi:hypothetical protein
MKKQIMIKIIIIITIVINFSICAIAQERYMKSEVLDFVKKDLDTKNYNSFDSTNNFHKSLKVGLYGSKLVPSSAGPFQNSNGFSTKIILEFSEWSSVSLDYIYIFNSIENRTTNKKSSYFNEISINYRPYIERFEFGWFFNIGLNQIHYFIPNVGISGSGAGAWGIHAGFGFDYSISDRISIEALARANLFLSVGLGRYYTINLGLNYKITSF